MWNYIVNILYFIWACVIHRPKKKTASIWWTLPISVVNHFHLTVILSSGVYLQISLLGRMASKFPKKLWDSSCCKPILRGIWPLSLSSCCCEPYHAPAVFKPFLRRSWPLLSRCQLSFTFLTPIPAWLTSSTQLRYYSLSSFAILQSLSPVLCVCNVPNGTTWQWQALWPVFSLLISVLPATSFFDYHHTLTLITHACMSWMTNYKHMFMDKQRTFYLLKGWKWTLSSAGSYCYLKHFILFEGQNEIRNYVCRAIARFDK